MVNTFILRNVYKFLDRFCSLYMTETNVALKDIYNYQTSTPFCSLKTNVLDVKTRIGFVHYKRQYI